MTGPCKTLTFMLLRLVGTEAVLFCGYCADTRADTFIEHKDCTYVGICRDCDMERLAVKGDFA